MSLALALVPPATILVFMASHDRAVWSRFLEDDAYYYLGVARNIVEGNGSTFAGVTETNGYQPLWLLILLPVAAVVRGPVGLVVATMVLQGVIWVAVVREALHIGRRVGGEVGAIAGVVGLGIIALAVRLLSFNGMETAPLLLCLLLAVRLGTDLDDDDAPAELRLGLVLALVCLARLDASVTAAGIGVVVLMRGRPGRAVALGRAARLLGPALTLLAIYGVINQLIFGLPVPVSGQAKAVGGPFLSSRPVLEALRVEAGGRSTWLGAISILLVGLAWLRGRWRSDELRRRLMAFAAVTVGAQLAFVGYLTVGSSYGMLWWYHYNTALMLFLSTLLLVEPAVDYLGPRAVRGTLFVAGSFLVGQTGLLFLVEAPVFSRSVVAAEFVQARLPADAVLAMGDRAGAVGYFAERPLLQLEGLTADAAYLTQLADGAAIQRMTGEGVDYYVRYSARGDRMPIGFDCWRTFEPAFRDTPLFSVVTCDEDLVYRTVRGGDELSIWRFRPELQEPAAQLRP